MQEGSQNQTSLATQKDGVNRYLDLKVVDFLKENRNLPKIREIERYDFASAIGVAITQIAFLGGFTGKIDDFNKRDIFEMISTHYSYLTIEDIMYAFKMERYGTYPNEKFFERTVHYGKINERLFNAEYVSEILKKWIEFKKRKHVSSRNEFLIEAKKGLTKEETDAIVKEGMISCYTNYIKNGEVDDLQFYVYDVLVKNSIIKFTKEEKALIIESVEKKLRPNQGDRNSFMKGVSMNEIMLGKKNIRENRCKTEALKVYFSRVEEKDYMELVKNIEIK